MGVREVPTWYARPYEACNMFLYANNVSMR